MKMRLGVTAIAAAMLPPCAWAQIPADELTLMTKMEVWTFWMMVTGVVSAIAASVGVAALVWTFDQQRQLAQSQERAFLQLAALSLVLKPDGRLNVALENTGRTPAFDVRVLAELWFVPVEAVTGVRFLKAQARSQPKPIRGKFMSLSKRERDGEKHRIDRLFEEQPPTEAEGSRCQSWYRLRTSHIAAGSTTTLKGVAEVAVEDFVADKLAKTDAPSPEGLFMIHGQVRYIDTYRRVRILDLLYRIDDISIDRVATVRFGDEPSI